MDFRVDFDVLQNYFREDNNYESQTEKRDDQKEITDKDEAEGEEYTNTHNEFVDMGDVTESDSDETESDSNEEWDGIEDRLHRTYLAYPWLNNNSDSDSTETLDSEDDQFACRYYMSKIKRRQINSLTTNSPVEPIDVLHEDEDEDETEIIEKSEIEASEKFLLQLAQIICS